MNSVPCPEELDQLAQDIKLWGHELGFADIGICDLDLQREEPRLQQWLDDEYHGQMDYMARHGMLRARPDELLAGTLRVISVRMNYMPPTAHCAKTLGNNALGYISRYALGRDYHKVLRSRLKQLAVRIQSRIASLGARLFVDSAPILERPLAAKAGLGWVGKHTLLINGGEGSFFFLGELLVNLPLPTDAAVTNQCGSCSACIKACPTGAIVAPYQLDARRCLSYLNIEYDGAIPLQWRKSMGNRVYGCDDCQLICPWNRLAPVSQEKDFLPRNALTAPKLLALFAWSEADFLKRSEGSAIRRIGYQRWQRNLAVALGNATYATEIIEALEARLPESSELVAEHIRWALSEQLKQQAPDRKKARLIRWIEKALPLHA